MLDEARRWADRDFVHQGSRTVTFGEHDSMVRAFVQRLQDDGVGPSDRVGILAANSPEWVALFFAILSLGAVVVPYNGWWAADEVRHACDVVAPSLVVCDELRHSRVPETVKTIVIDEVSSLDPSDATLRWQDRGLSDENEPAVVLFTAGTTSFPKGASLSHRSLVSNLQTLLTVSGKLPHQLPDDPRASVTLVGLPLFHIGAIQLILVPMMTGSQIVFLEGRFDASAVLEQMSRRGVTMFSGVPTMMERLLASPALQTCDVSSLRTVVLGGAPVEERLLARIRAAFPGTHRGVGQTYGLTEAGGVVSTGVGSKLGEHPGSSGKLAPVVEARIEEPDEDGNGRIVIRSPAAMDGYIGAQGAQPIDEDGWLDTGDIGHLDSDQYLYITGRAKDVIIRGGENIAAARVEAVLTSHPLVAEASVVALPDPEWGQIVAAAIRLNGCENLDLDSLQAFAGERLASFAVPTLWWIRDDPLPTNDAGKILKTQIVHDWPRGK